METNIIIEESETNFGHEDIIWKGKINFPDKIIQSDGEIEKKVSRNKPFDKQNEIDRALDANDIQPVKNQKDFFKIIKYSYKNKKNPNFTDGPTLSLSLFMPNKILQEINKENEKLGNWTKRYFLKQIKLCLVFNYFFPNGNIRNYIDNYLLEKLKNLPGDDKNLLLTQLIKKFNYFDFNDEKTYEINNFLTQFYNKVKELEETVKFNNSLERFIFYFDLACSSYYNSGILTIKEKTGDFFAYKLNGPFLENKDTDSEGHISNGYIGQLIRYLALRQKDYLYNGIMIKKPCHLVYRDAHTCCPGYIDSLWINELNKYKSTTVYLLPVSNSYQGSWHDFGKCEYSNSFYKKSVFAGLVQVINSEINSDDNLYLKTIGIAFIINLVNEIPLNSHRSIGKHFGKNVDSFDYGIEEYLLTSFFENNKIKKKTIFINIKLSWDRFFNTYVINNAYDQSITIDKFKNLGFDNFYYDSMAYILLTNYLVNNNKLRIEHNLKDFIIESEKLRNDISLKDNLALGFLLSLVPNIYHLGDTLFENASNDFLFIEIDGVIYYTPNSIFGNRNINQITELFVSNINKNLKEIIKNKITKFDNITFDNLNDLGISCKKNLVNTSPVAWCTMPFTDPYYKEINKCHPDNFYSGFYFEKPPALDIGILRQPSDLLYSVEALQNNNLKFKLNKSDYKLNTANKNLINKIKNSLENEIQGTIKEPIKLIIFNFSEKTKSIYKFITADFDILGTGKNIINPLVWKSLNYANFDVPPEWFQIDLSSNFINSNKLNYYVKELANTNGWADYTIEVLNKAGSAKNIQYINLENGFNDKIIKDFTAEYILSANENKNDFLNLKMEMIGGANFYLKYLKYKNKYLEMKKNKF